MRLLLVNKHIPVAYLKSGKDHGSYDAEKLLWFPGRTTPVRRPDYKLAGKTRMGTASPLAAPPPKVRAPLPHDTDPGGLYVAKPKPFKPEPLIIARH
jgi:hypothetical protein